MSYRKQKWGRQSFLFPIGKLGFERIIQCPVRSTVYRWGGGGDKNSTTTNYSGPEQNWNTPKIPSVSVFSAPEYFYPKIVTAQNSSVHGLDVHSLVRPNYDRSKR